MLRQVVLNPLQSRIVRCFRTGGTFGEGLYLDTAVPRSVKNLKGNVNGQPCCAEDGVETKERTVAAVDSMLDQKI